MRKEETEEALPAVEARIRRWALARALAYPDDERRGWLFRQLVAWGRAQAEQFDKEDER
jgi:hypothetical protein